MLERSDRLKAWQDMADRLHWARPPEAVFDAAPAPRGRWFAGGELNVAANCLDRHLPERHDRVAFYWEGEPGDRRQLTYGDLADEVGRFAAVLHSLGVEAGDRIALHMGLLPETVVAMLACARLGAVHAIMPAVLPPDALQERVRNIQARVVITQDGAWRHGLILPLKARADEAVAGVSSVEHTIVVHRTGLNVSWYEGDNWYHDLTGAVTSADAPNAAAFPAEHPLCVAHVANRRERPTGVVHGSANLLAYVLALHSGAFGGPDEVFWFPSEVGWLAGQSNAVYGPLVSGGTGVLYEGMLDTPSHARAWEIVERYDVGVLAATPSIVRSLRGWSTTRIGERQLSSLRRLITAGEAIDEELVSWLQRELTSRGVELFDGWGQTELGGVVAFNSPPNSDLDVPDPALDVVDDDGRSLPDGDEGELVLRHHWPATFVAIEADDLASLRCFTRHPGFYATGDRARRRPDGTLHLLGRIDPVISVSGQIVSLTEVQEALLEHPYVARAVVAERSDGEHSRGVVALIEPNQNAADRGRLAVELSAHIKDTLGGLSRPRTIVFADAIPDELSEAEARRATRALCSLRRAGATLHVRGSELAELARAGGPA
jgi:acetyl-CoA synthetase